MGVKPPKEPRTFTGVVGRESKKKDGKQGIHHHPMMNQLGPSTPGGLKPGGDFTPPGSKGGYC